MFTLEGSLWEIRSEKSGSFTKTSPIEVWGQVLKPLMFRISGYSKVFGIRFHPAAAAFFLKEDVSQLNDNVLDLQSIVGNNVNEFHSKLQDAKTGEERILLTDSYLLGEITQSRLINKIDLVKQVMTELTKKDFFDNIENVAERHGITSRYLQKLFVQQTGLSPKLYSKINRFQNSVVLLGQKDLSLTSIAYSCGYFDQSHFIREFKSFTGFAPSTFKSTNFTAILASPNKL
jgi:AraC-like DNA-binding protein